MKLSIRHLFIAAIGLFVPFLVFAHQPQLAAFGVTISEPEISKAYYSRLAGEPHIYHIFADQPFALYVNILVPDLPGQETDFTVDIFKDGGLSVPFARLDGSGFSWQKFFEPFGHDDYLKGPEYRTLAAPGRYDIYVSSRSGNHGKYTLAVGEKETFGLVESLDTFRLVPKIKRDFFAGSPATFILSPLGQGLIVAFYILAFLIGYVATRLIGSKRSSRLAAPGRLLRAVIGVVLLIIAIETTWNMILIFLSGLFLFSAVSGRRLWPALKTGS